jgi:predicted RNA-binding Zn-ribbon protein involved in translation (DUF1610 family)
MSDRHTDGNHMAGLLATVLAADVTTTVRRCQSCGGEAPLGAHRAYQGAGTVLRCPGCGAVAVRVAEAGAELVVEWRGTYRMPAAR